MHKGAGQKFQFRKYTLKVCYEDDKNLLDILKASQPMHEYSL